MRRRQKILKGSAIKLKSYGGNYVKESSTVKKEVCINFTVSNLTIQSTNFALIMLLLTVIAVNRRGVNDLEKANINIAKNPL